jgi:hypothetical protein
MKKVYALMVCITVCGAALFAQTRAGLYVGDTFQDSYDLTDAVDWLTEYAQEGGNYTIVLGKDQKTSGRSLSYGGKKVAVTLKADGGTRTVTRGGGSLFTVGAGVTFTLEEGVTLSGAGASYGGGSLVRVKGGMFIMNGGTISGNTAAEKEGGGVYMEGGTFTMRGGAISGNTVSGLRRGLGSGSGGGVRVVDKGTFTMSGGEISGNNASYGGGVFVGYNCTFTMTNGAISRNTADDSGGVYVTGTFTMSGGAISGNTASDDGGGVYVDGGTFTKSGGIIHGSNAPKAQANKANSDEDGHAVYVKRSDRPYIRNTTADETTALDSTKNRIQGGGWE